MFISSSTQNLLAVAIASGVFGFWLAVGLSLPISRSPQQDFGSKDGGPAQADDSDGFETEEDSDEEDERLATRNAKLDRVKAAVMEECKLVLVVNQELGMQKGKIAAQCGHATLACYKTLAAQNPKLLQHWERTGQAKVAVKCTSTADLLELQAKALSLGVCAKSIQDAGRTQVAAGSRTVLGIGPAPVKLINEVTGHLKLL